jgi:hypothetical protein
MPEREAAPSRRVVAGVALLVALVAGGAGAQDEGGAIGGDDRSAPRETAAPRLTPGAILPAVDPDAPMDPERARALQDVVRIAREDADDALVRERIACYRRFFVSRCLADVRERERLIRARLDRIEVAVNRTLREADALELNRRTAEALAAREASAAADAARRDENRRAFEARTAAAEAERARREAEAPEIERRAAANRAERERREAENAQRRADAERRAAGDAERAAARQRELDERRRETEARDAREAAQRARRREEAARREEEAGRRDVRREDRAPRPGEAPPGGAGTAAPVR